MGKHPPTRQARDLAKYSQLWLSAGEWNRPKGLVNPVHGRKEVLAYIVDRKRVNVTRDLLPTSDRTLKAALADMLQDRNVPQNRLLWASRAPTPPEAVVSVTLFTSFHQYQIGARVKGPKDTKGYLGCIMHNRRVDPGEVYHRMSDLHDGEFDEDTLDRILFDIVACETEVILGLSARGRKRKMERVPQWQIRRHR